MPQAAAPAGWYPTPDGQQRYWDGSTWLDTPPPPAAGGATPAKKKRRIFVWVFLAVQVLFGIWVIAGISSGSGQPSDCGMLDKSTCNAASDAGTAFGVAMVVVFWCVVDFLMGVGYAVYRLARRP